MANGFYQGGGYIATLGPSVAEAITTVNDLNATGWIDEATRAVIVEVALYSPTSDAYLLLQGLVEFTFVCISYLQFFLTTQGWHRNSNQWSITTLG